MEVDSECWDSATCRDPRVAESWLFGSLSSTFALLLVYLAFTKVIGPKIMGKRKPLNVEKTMIVYNTVQTIANAWLAYKIFTEIMMHNEYSFFCAKTKVRSVDKIYEAEAVKCFRFYLFLKWTDLTDTIFMVLKKNYHQISFLHLYHHFSMVVCTTLSYIFAMSTHTAILGTSNSAVHALMYLYYLCSAINPEVKKSVGLKKSITTIQMLSHLIIGVHSVVTFFNPYCNLPKLVSFLMTLQSVVIFSLFAKFFYKAYIAPKPKSNVKKQ